tara:strand:- start:5544 stop:6161 length:618 start_codon:yes stop_codon:yes gene_type:complete
MKNTTENNKLIIELLGYKLKPCNNGQAWERPTLSSIHDELNLHGRLWRKNDNYYKFDSDWNWLMLVVKKIKFAFDELENWRMITNPSDYPIENVFRQVAQFIKWHNEQPQTRLEYLRRELRAERISYGELAELQSLAEYIEKGDVELLEAARVEEEDAPSKTCLVCDSTDTRPDYDSPNTMRCCEKCGSEWNCDNDITLNARKVI